MRADPKGISVRIGASLSHVVPHWLKLERAYWLHLPLNTSEVAPEAR